VRPAALAQTRRYAGRRDSQVYIVDMLPSKFFDPPISSKGGGLAAQRCAPPPLGMTGVMCKIGTLNIPNRGTIHYRIFRPRQLEQKPPLIVLHGGPLIPSTYLLPLAYVVVDRSIVVYDQLGCGQSATVANSTVLSKLSQQGEATNKLDVDGMVKDLDALVDHWKFSQFHLLGHSFGGILLFEYLKYCQAHNNKSMTKCRGAILASAPTSVSLVEQEVQRLCQDLPCDQDDANDDDDDDDEGFSTLSKKVPKRFREQHECRLVPIPFPLTDAYSRAGPPRLRGMQSLGEYKATLKGDEDTDKDDLNSTISGDSNQALETSSSAAPAKLSPPVLILRGQHDFVTEACVQGWDELFQHAQHMTLAGCSHYGMLENEIMYGSVITSFLGDCDKQNS
jgi:proline iminopeptidase